jgi:beta propeller repeat protein
MLAGFLQLASFAPLAKAAPSLEVVCVPWKGNEALPHPTWSGNEVTLKGTARYAGDVNWEWDFGDGSAASTGSVAATADYPYPISAWHAYGGVVGTEYVAMLRVTAGGETKSDVYLVEILAQNLEVEADVAIDEGLWWLYQGQQRSTSEGVDLGFWGGWARVANTGAAVQAFENNLHKPFGELSKDPYVDCVQRGLNFLFTMAYPVTIPADDPYGGDTNGNGFGIACHDWEQGGREMYEVGIAMMAIVSSDTPGRVTVTGPANVIGRTYQDITQDMADYCAWAQNDAIEDGSIEPGLYMYDLTNSTQSLVSAGSDDWPDISGDKVVWVDTRNGNNDIYMYDLSTSTETPICTDPANQMYPSISGDKIVWFDDRSGNYDIYMYDLSTSTETPICVDPSNQYVPTVSGDRVTWTDERNGNYDIYMYDLSTSTETPICIDPAGQLWQDISGDKIVWMDTRNGNADIYMYDLSTGTEKPVCVNSASQENPAISGEKVVWQDNRNGTYDIYMYDLSSSTETPIYVGLLNQYYADISGDRIVWMDYRNGKIDADIYAYDLASATETAICIDARDQYYPAVSGGTIVWVTQPYGSPGDPNRVGGWRYQPNYPDSDNSVTQWPIMGLDPAEAKWGIEIPDFVRERLEQWLTYSQCKQEGWAYGGYGYTGPDWPNVARTAGSGLSGLVFCDVPVEDDRIQSALQYVDRDWENDNFGNEYAMYGVKKAYDEFLGMKSTGSHNWWDEYANYLIPIQQVDGRWDQMSGWSSGTELTTAWIIIILTPGVYDVPPTAVAKANGFDSTEVDQNQTVNFDASQSKIGSYEIVRYEWDFESDGIYDAVGMTATHSYAAYGIYTATLRTIDNRDVATGGEKQAMSDTDNCTVWVHEPPHPPIADANGPYPGWPGAAVTLDGSGSWDPNPADSISLYAWDLDNDGVFENSTDTPTLDHTWGAEGTYPIALMVQDDSEFHLWSTEASRTTVVVVGNHDPVAHPNGPYETLVGQAIVLDGSGSSDPDEPVGDFVASYQWDLDNDGDYDDAVGPNPTFMQVTAASYTVRLKVTDTLGATGTDWTTVTVKTPLVVTTNDATSIATTSATLNGELTSLGTADNVMVSFLWGTTAGGPYPNETTSQDMTSTGAFSVDLTGLTPGTTYYYKAKAVGNGTSYGDEKSFTTTTTPPAVTTNDASNVTTTSATLNGHLTSLGTASSVTVSFLWGTTAGGPYPNETTGQDMTSTGAFSVDLTGLTPGTTYYYRAKAVGNGTSYGDEKRFTTSNAGSITATIDFDPDTLNLKSKGNYVTVYIELPRGYLVTQIDISSIRLNGTVPALAKPKAIGDYDKDGIPDLMVKFDRAAVQKILALGNQVEITITGKVAGVDFEGSDTIRVIKEGGIATAGASGDIPYLGYVVAGLLGCFVIAAGMLTFLMWGRPLPRRA